MTVGVFDVLASDRSREISLQREAVVRADLRARDFFGSFLAGSRSPQEFEARLELAAGDIRGVVDGVASASAGVDAADLHQQVLASLRDAYSPAQTKESVRRPHLCPYHRDMVNVALAEGSPSAGYSAVSNLAWSDKHCESGEYEGNRCKFRPEMTTQSFWDEREEKLQERREQRQEQQVQPEQPLEVEDVEVEAVPEEGTVPEEVTDAADEAGNLTTELQDAPSAVGFGAEDGDLAVAASVRKEAPGKQHLPGASDKRNRQYEHIKENCLEEGKSEDECKELAARTVNKQRAEHGETKGSAKQSWGNPGDGYGDMDYELGDYEDEDRAPDCPACGGPGVPLGSLGSRNHYRCRNCGWTYDDQQVPPQGDGDQPINSLGPEYDRPFHSRQAEALETVDVQKGRPDTPEPKMDTTRWTPDNPGPVGDVEMDGSPHPTRQQDIAVTPQYKDSPWEDDGRLDQTEAVTERKDVTEKHETKPETDNNFPGSRDLSAVSSADDNPLRQYVDGDFVPPSQLEDIISAYES